MVGFQGTGQSPGLCPPSKGCRGSEWAVGDCGLEEKVHSGRASQESENYIHKPALDSLVGIKLII